MSFRLFGRAGVLVSILALAGWATPGGNASAAVWVGNWDPVFNTSFDADFAWRGTVTVQTNAGSDGAADASYAVGPLPCTSVAITALMLEFYDGDLVFPQPAVHIYSFIAPSPVLPAVSNVRIQANQVDGIETNAFLVTTLAANSSPLLAPPESTSAWNVFLEFNLVGAPVVLVLERDGCSQNFSCDQNRYASNAPGGGAVTMTWGPANTVSEPGSLALAGVAALGWAMARRRRPA